MRKMQIQLCFGWSLAASMVWLLKVWCDWAFFRFQSCQNYRQRSQAAKDLGKFDDISLTWSLEFLYFLVKFFTNKRLKRFSLEAVRHHSITQSHGHLLVNSIQAFHASAAPELLAKSVISVIRMHWLGEHREQKMMLFKLDHLHKKEM